MRSSCFESLERVSIRRVLMLSLVVSLIGLTGIGLTGCDGESPPSQEAGTSPPLTGVSMRGYGNPDQKLSDPGKYDAESIKEETTEIDRRAETADGWKKAHKEVKGLLEASSSAPQFLREQAAAYAMFRYYLSDEEWRRNITEEKAEVLGFYTSLLVENQSPESDLVYSGLQGLEGRWSEQQVSDAARKTLKAANKRYGSSGKSGGAQGVSSAEGVSSEENGPTPGLAGAEERHAERMIEINRKLKAMLESSD